jgi:hypothetical protein
VDNRSRTLELERPDIKFVGRASLAELQATFDLTSRLLRLDPARALPLECGMAPVSVGTCEMSELEQAFLRDAAHLMAIERTARACRERGGVLT